MSLHSTCQHRLLLLVRCVAMGTKPGEYRKKMLCCGPLRVLLTWEVKLRKLFVALVYFKSLAFNQTVEWKLGRFRLGRQPCDFCWMCPDQLLSLGSRRLTHHNVAHAACLWFQKLYSVDRIFQEVLEPLVVDDPLSINWSPVSPFAFTVPFSFVVALSLITLFIARGSLFDLEPCEQ